MTVRDIAKLAGVSPATVSRYFTGTENVSDETSGKIREIIDRLGYKPPQKVKKESGVIGVLMAHMRYGFYSEVMREMIEQIPRYSFNVVFIPTIDRPKFAYKQIIKKLELDGLIFMEEDINSEILELVAELGLKTVVCGGAALDCSATAVHVNDLAAAYEGTKYLIALGHEKIVFLSDYPHSISSGFQRLTGSRKAMEENGLYFDEDCVKYGEVTYEVGYRATQELITSGAEFTAIFAFSDEMATGAIAALFDRNLRVPEDVSVLGFDDLSLAAKIRPGLTTVHQPIADFVKSTLDSFVRSDNGVSHAAITLPHRIQERGSCRRLVPGETSVIQAKVKCNPL